MNKCRMLTLVTLQKNSLSAHLLGRKEKFILFQLVIMKLLKH